MARTLLNGSEQIQAGTIPWSAMATGAIVPIASIISGSNIILSTGSVAMAASLAMGGNTITGQAAPVNPTDGANKAYVDAKVSGVGGIFFAATIATANVATLSGLPTVDSYTMTAGQIVLLSAQSTGSQNGPWVVAAGSWTRPTWWASATTASPGSYFYVDNFGTTYHDTKWWMTTVGTITIDTTSIAFTEDLSGTTYSAGAGGGLTLTGAAFSVNTGNGITLSGGNVTAVGTGVISVGGSGIALVNSTSAGQMMLGNASDVPTWTTLSGDAALSGAGALTLNSVNANTGAFGAGNAIPILTLDAKGRVTAATTASIAAPAGALTGTALAATVVSSSLTSVGILTSLSVSGNSTLTGVATLAAAPVLASLTGFLYGNGSSAVTASTTIPSTALNLSANEIPSGALNGTNTTYTLAHAPANSSLELCLNGVTLRPGASYDYTISGAVVTMNYAPASTDYVSGYYFY